MTMFGVRRFAFVATWIAGLALGEQAFAAGPSPGEEPKPFHPIADTTLYQTAVMVGTVSLKAMPPGMPKTAVSLAPAVLDGMIHAADHRGSRLQAHLVLIDQDAGRLKQLHTEGRELRTDPEAQRIVSRLMDDRQQHTTTGFLFRAVASQDGAMAVARVGGESFLQHVLGKAVFKSLRLSQFEKWKVTKKWLNEKLGKDQVKRLSSFLQGENRRNSYGWKRLEFHANAVKSFHQELAKYLVSKMLKRMTIKAIDERIEQRWNEIQSELEADARRLRSRTVTPSMLHLRLVTEPQVAIPAIAAELTPIQAAKPIVLPAPPQRRYADPLVCVAETQKSINQTIRQGRPQPTRRKYKTYNRGSEDSGGYVGLNNPDYWATDYWENNHWTDNNVSHPTRNSSGINYDPGSNFRGNWDGASTGSFWSK